MMERFIVYGVSPDDKDTFVEIRTNVFTHACVLADLTSAAGYKARIWDNEKQGYVLQVIIDLVLKAMEKK
jgi:hypothetical protein